MVRRALLSLLAALALPALAAPAALGAVDVPQAGAPAPALSPDGVIVQWVAGANRGQKAAARAGADVTYAATLGNPSFQLVEVEPGQSPAAAVAALAADPAVAVAERDAYIDVHGIPNDPLFGQLWGLRNTGAGVAGVGGAVAGDDANVVVAWDRAVGTPATVVADIDSGYRFQHPDLASVVWTNPDEIANNGVDDDANGFVDDVHGWDFVGENLSAISPDNNPSDENLVSGGHGVHTAGTIGARGDDGFGMTGVARNVSIMPLRVCSNVPATSELKCTVSGLVAAINYAGQEGARVANISLGGNTYNQAEVNAIAENPETLYVISAGNDGGDNDGGGAAPKGHHYPCDYRPDTESSPPVSGAIDNVVCVAATDQADKLASFSDWGATSVDLAAPGTEILSTFPKQEVPLSDDFETNDFAANWDSSGFGRAPAGDGPLTSFGLTDSPGATPLANSATWAERAESVAIPAGAGSCRIKGLRSKKGGVLRYGVVIDGLTTRNFTVSADTEGSALVFFQSARQLDFGGHDLRLYFEYEAGATPLASDGAWLDDVRIECYGPINAGPDFAFLQGTSMAAPHVTGAAALLFSIKPAASVTEVRNALLQSAEQVPSLAGKTTTGGRLDVAAALDLLVPVGSETVAPDTEILTAVGAGGTSTSASFGFQRTDADAGEFECKLDGALSWTACTSPAGYTVEVGDHQFQVRAKVPSGLVDPTPASFSWTVESPPAPPAAPVLEATSPLSPAANGTPRILGSAAGGTVVKIYAGAACAGAPVSTGPASQLAAPGLLVNVAAGTTAEFTATATGPTELVSDCSAPISYTNSSTTEPEPETKPPVQPPVVLPPVTPPPVPSGCKVPKLSGKTLAQAKAALKTAGCTLGKVTKPKPRKGVMLVVKSSSPAAGASASGKVNLKLGPKPKRK